MLPFHLQVDELAQKSVERSNVEPFDRDLARRGHRINRFTADYSTEGFPAGDDDDPFELIPRPGSHLRKLCQQDGFPDILRHFRRREPPHLWCRRLERIRRGSGTQTRFLHLPRQGLPRMVDTTQRQPTNPSGSRYPGTRRDARPPRIAPSMGEVYRQSAPLDRPRPHGPQTLNLLGLRPR